MNIYYSLYIFEAVLTAGLIGVVADAAFHRRRTRSASSFAVMQVFACGWVLISGLLPLFPNKDFMLGGILSRMIFISLIVPTWVVFILQYTGRFEEFGLKKVIYFYLFPLINIGMAFTNSTHHLLWKKNVFISIPPIHIQRVIYGPWFWLFVGFNFFLILWGMIILIRTFYRSSGICRKQALALILATSCSVIISFLSTIYKISEFGVDLSVFGFTLSTLIYFYALFRLRLFDLVPVALNAMIDNMVDVMLVLDDRFQIINANPAFGSIFGVPAHEVQGKDSRLFLPALAEIVNEIPTGKADTEVFEREIEYCREDKKFVFDASFHRLGDPRTLWIGWLLMLHDITLLKKMAQSEMETRAIAERRVAELKVLHIVTETLNQRITLETVLQSGLEKVVNLMGISVGWIIVPEGKSLRLGASFNTSDYFPEGNGPLQYCCNCPRQAEMMHVNSPDAVKIWKCDLLLRENAPGSLPLHVIVPLKQGGATLGTLNLVSNPEAPFTEDELRLFRTIGSQFSAAIERARLLEGLKQQAITDSLTGLLNRRHFYTLAQREMDRLWRYHHPFALIMLDIDHFKLINDTYGHTVGDMALMEVARSCQETLRHVDVLARYGGEEFLILMPETNAPSAVQVAERLRLKISDLKIETDKGIVRITASLGVLLIKEDNRQTLDQMIEQVDQAMYRAKRHGRNRVAIWHTPSLPKE